MKKYTRLWIVIGAVIIIGAAATFLLLQPNGTTVPQATVPTENETPEQERTTEAPTPTAAVAKGVYAPYSETAFAAAEDKRRVLFFHANWCPQCRALDGDLNSKPLPDNAAIFKLDYDSNQALRQKYGVTLQTTFVEVDKNGNKKNAYVAYETPNLGAVVKALGL